MPDKPELGQIAYEAYWEDPNIFSATYVVWEELSPDLQECWQRAAKAVITYTSQ